MSHVSPVFPIRKVLGSRIKATMGERIDPVAALAHARRTWPAVVVPDDAVAGYVADRGGDHTDDLYLACAICRRDPAALGRFESTLLPAIDAAIRRLAPDPDFASEVRQRVREHLLVGDHARLGDYQGRGPLVSWVRIVAVRIGLQLLRGRRADARRDEALADEPLLSYLDIERELIKARYQAQFRAAFHEAMAELPSHDKHLLQLHVIEGLSLSQIGKMHGVNKSTVSRWLAHTRTTLEESVRERLSAVLAVGDAELDSLLGVLRSRLDLSIERILEDREGT